MRSRLEAACGVLLFLLLGVFLTRTFSSPFRAQVVTSEQEQTTLPRLPTIESVPEPPASAPTPTTETVSMQSSYSVHSNITATFFWVGEAPSEENGYISNAASAWDISWAEHFGGTDDPEDRNGYLPGAFTPKENPFYIALPYSEFSGRNLKENADQIYWYAPVEKGESLLKNRWIKISANGKTVYGQWEDVGPYETDDVDYVFGADAPQGNVGLDVSPAIRDYLGFGGKTTVSWQFVDEKNVPAGPWKEIVTTSGISW